MRPLWQVSSVLCGVCALALTACGSSDSNLSGSSDPEQAGQAGQTSSGDVGEAGATVTVVNGKDGTNGVDGKDGTNGTNGVDGKDGTNGTNGVDGKDGTNGTNGSDGTNGANGKNSLITTTHELAGDNCAFGGVRVQSGLDQNANGTLESDEINAAQTQFVCTAEPAWSELAPLPAVTTAYSFALATNDQDGTPRLGYMFTDATYLASLDASGVLWHGGGVYDGPQGFAVYKLGADKAWAAYQGRSTPQTYQYSELTFNAGQSYYTTTYPSFGGLVSVVRNGMGGAYALTPAFTTRKSHSVGFSNGQLFALVAQKTPGLTLSTIPADQVGATVANLWTNLVTLETNASTVTDPSVLSAGNTLVAAYAINGGAVVRASTSPATLAQAADFSVIGQLSDTAHLSVAWDGSKLYLATLSASGVLTVQRTALENPSWETLATHVTGAVSDISLAGSANGVLLGIRQTNALRVYLSPTDAQPAFDAVLAGNFSLINAATGPVLAVLNLDPSATHTLRTFAR